jgi:hypothetical protein
VLGVTCVVTFALPPTNILPRFKSGVSIPVNRLPFPIKYVALAFAVVFKFAVALRPVPSIYVFTCALV